MKAKKRGALEMILQIYAMIANHKVIDFNSTIDNPIIQVPSLKMAGEYTSAAEILK